MKKIKYICMMLVFAVLLGGCLNISVEKPDLGKLDTLPFYIEDEGLKTIGGNVHYYESFLESKFSGEDAKEAIKCFEILSDHIKDMNFEVEVIVENANFLDDSLIVNVSQYYDGVTITQANMFFDVSSKGAELEDIGGGIFINNGIIEERNILNIEDFYDTALKMFKEHEKEIINGSSSKGAPVRVETIYNEDGYFFFFSTLNGSYVKINAEEGSIVDEYYFNGIYY